MTHVVHASQGHAPQESQFVPKWHGRCMPHDLAACIVCLSTTKTNLGFLPWGTTRRALRGTQKRLLFLHTGCLAGNRQYSLLLQMLEETAVGRAALCQGTAAVSQPGLVCMTDHDGVFCVAGGALPPFVTVSRAFRSASPSQWSGNATATSRPPCERTEATVTT